MADVGVLLAIHPKVPRGTARARHRVFGASSPVVVQKANKLAESDGRTVSEYEPSF